MTVWTDENGEFTPEDQLMLKFLAAQSAVLDRHPETAAEMNLVLKSEGWSISEGLRESHFQTLTAGNV